MEGVFFPYSRDDAWLVREIGLGGLGACQRTPGCLTFQDSGVGVGFGVGVVGGCV